MATTLYHNDVAFDPTADGTWCELGTLRRSFASPFTFDLFRGLPFDAPDGWQNNDAIRLDVDGTTRFAGRITAHERAASASSEGIRYQCVGLRDQARDVAFRKTIVGAATSRLVYNCPPDEAEEEALHLAAEGTTSTVGDIVADILDTMAAELSGIVGDGTPGSGYTAAQLAALDAIPGKVVLDGLAVDEAIDDVLRHMPNVAWYVDPASRKAVFVDLAALAAKDVPGVNGSVIRQCLNTTTAGCYTACTVEGARQLVDIYDQALAPDWDGSLEETWDLLKAMQYPDTYGRVFRKWKCTAAIANGGRVRSKRAVGTGEIVCVFRPGVGLARQLFTCMGVAADDGTSLWTRGWPVMAGGYGDRDEDGTDDGTFYSACGYASAWYTYATARLSGRYPASGYTGTAYTARGLERERFITQEDRGRVLVRGTVSETDWLGKTEGDEAIRSHYTMWLTDELAGKPITFDRTSETRTVVANLLGKLVLDQAPEQDLEVGDTFTIAIRDDGTADGSGLSPLEAYAREFVRWHGDEKFQGSVPLDGLDWSLGLGQAINFTGTDDPDLASLGATLLEVAHDLAAETTSLTLTSERSVGGETSWAEFAARRQRRRRIHENETQIRRLWDRTLRLERPARATGTGGEEKEDDEAFFPGFDTEAVAGHDWITIAAAMANRSRIYTVFHDKPAEPVAAQTRGAIGVSDPKTVIGHMAWDDFNHVLTGTERRLTGDDHWLSIDVTGLPTGEGVVTGYAFVHEPPYTGPTGATGHGTTGQFIAVAHADARGHVVDVDLGGVVAGDHVTLSTYGDASHWQIHHDNVHSPQNSWGPGVIKKIEIDWKGHVAACETTGKTAILALGGGWRGLYCAEMPECRFLDVLRFEAAGARSRVAIDPLFVEACEPGTIVVLAANPERVLPGRAAFRVEDGQVVGEFEPPLHAAMPLVVTLSGIRRRATERFPEFTEAVARRNAAFWASAHKEVGKA